MANVTGISLAIEVVNSGPDLQAKVTVEYDITFNSYDQHSNQVYKERCRLIGDDTGITPAEDGTDDAIPGGQLFPGTGFPGSLFDTVASNGQASIHRTRTKTLPLSALNEDTAPTLNPDELRAQITLTPVVPAVQVGESSQVVFNLN